MSTGFQKTRVDVGRSHLSSAQTAAVGIEGLEAIAQQSEAAGQEICSAQVCRLRSFAALNMLNHGQLMVEVECRNESCPSLAAVEGAARLARTAINEALSQ
jgi:hypothetical protein